MEDILDENISIDSIDEFGNTLFLIATQQGYKKMCKFLLRRGAQINQQNYSGNMCLHYCYTYSYFELADYLKSKVS